MQLKAKSWTQADSMLVEQNSGKIIDIDFDFTKESSK